MADPLETLLRECTVRVTGGPMPGAGFFVAPGKVLTCLHVIGDSVTLAVRWERDGQPAQEVPVSGRAAVLDGRGRPIPALDGDYPDIAVLEVDGLDDHPCVEIDREWPSSEDSFLVFGYPKEGGAVQLTPARLTYRGPHGIKPTAYLDLASDTIKPGMSGAAVLNLRTGAVCGVVVASKHPTHSDGALAIPWSAIVADLGEVLDANRVFHLSDLRWDEAAAGIPGHKGKFNIYLSALIDWLGRDPWPHDLRFGGPVLTPAVIERKLRITTRGPDQKRDFDADDLTRRCQRLVILGGPGSGKTWLAKRTARRCAEEALAALKLGREIDEIELPLYTTCSRLFAAGGDIRSAAVSSALDQLGDLGSSKLNAVLGRLFTERNAPVVLVIDSLDEASGSDERLRQADTLPWRIVLTSRPSSWNHQLVIREQEHSHRVGDLLPLRYPEDVEPFINEWFNQRPDRSSDLRAQIAQRPGLQQAATVPLILTFYCLLADQRLPEFRRDLHMKVLNRMLTSRWRDSHYRRPNTHACLRTLRTWAWAAAASHPVSGVGTWQDDILTGPSLLDDAENDAIEHVATSLELPDVDTGEIPRRFIHRSMREYLVAEHVASLPVGEAAQALLPHLWYDPDWEFSAPAAIAMHPQRDPLLRDLMRQAAKSAQAPEDLSVIDAGWEFRRLLARIASESNEADWSTAIARVIDQARVDLAMSGRVDELVDCLSWRASNRRVCEALLRLLGGKVSGTKAKRLVASVVQLALISDDRLQVLDSLLKLLAHHPYADVAAELVSGILRLTPTAEHKREARDAIVELLVGESSGPSATRLTDQLIRLNPSIEDQRRAREVLLSLLVSEEDFWVVEYLTDRIVQLAPTTEDKQQARDALLDLLAEQDDQFVMEPLVKGVVQLALTTEDKQQARDALLDLLAEQDHRSSFSVLMRGVAQLVFTPADKRQVREVLPLLLAGESLGEVADELVKRTIALAETAEEKRQVLAKLLRLVISQFNWVDTQIVDGITRLDPTMEDKRRVREALLGFLTRTNDERVASAVVHAIVPLDPTAEDKRRGREALLALLANQTSSSDACSIASLLTELGPTSDDKSSVRKTLLSWLARETKARAGANLASLLMQLDPTTEDKFLARDALFALLGRPDRYFLLSSISLLEALVQLMSAGEDKHSLRQALLELLVDQTGDLEATTFVKTLAQLDPELNDIRCWREWAVRPTPDLLAAVRRNSALETWLTALPLMSPLSH